MTGLLTWVADLPPLRRPVLIVALEGFVDAGGVAATAATFLRHRWRGETVAVLDGEALIDYRARRPIGVVDSGQLRRLEWPEIELVAARTGAEHDALLLLGPEPDARWRSFSDAVAEMCRLAGVEVVIGLGAYPAATPHTRPVRILQARNAVAGDVVPEVGSIAGYVGPVGAGTALQAVLAEHGIPAVGLWAEVPHYIAGTPNPQGALALVRLLASTVGTTVDTTELEAAANLHAEQVARAIAEHPEAAEMVSALELHVDSGGDDMELPSGDDLAAEIERFLRSRPE